MILCLLWKDQENLRNQFYNLYLEAALCHEAILFPVSLSSGHVIVCKVLHPKSGGNVYINIHIMCVCVCVCVCTFSKCLDKCSHGQSSYTYHSCLATVDSIYKRWADILYSHATRTDPPVTSTCFQQCNLYQTALSPQNRRPTTVEKVMWI